MAKDEPEDIGDPHGADASQESTGEPTQTVQSKTQPRLLKKIGQFHVKGVIASGGMGTVYRAVQEHPRRTVAVKVMRHGIASRSAMRRFEYESQLLARLRHPGIAQVYEAGTHRDDSGTVPFFAMEYIPNALPITKYATDKKLSTREKLELFAKVCDAVHHGHQKGIIHRDLKPSNILVDSAGQPRIIDFGVARGTDSDMAVTTLQTDIGQLVGTLQYMSPEQCLADPHDLDTRSDVYALGVVLYELLSGKLPYTVSSTRIYDGARVIREDQPTKLTTTDRTLKGDIETIVLKALEKDRERRYRSAADFGDDINRYVAGEAIIARPPSVFYQFRVLVRRNKAIFGAIAAVFVVLLGGVIVSTSLYVRAEQRETKARISLEFMEGMFRSLDPFAGGATDVVSMLDEATRKIDDGELAEHPEIEASIRYRIARTYYVLGKYSAAKPHADKCLSIRRRVLGDEHPKTLRAEWMAASSLWKVGQLDEAETLARRTLATRRRVHGPDHSNTLTSMNRLATILADQGKSVEAEELTRRVLEACRSRWGERKGACLWPANNLGELLNQQERFGEAEIIWREALREARSLHADHVIHAWLKQGLAACLLGQRKNLDEAREMATEALRDHLRVYGEDYHETQVSRDVLMRVLTVQGKYDELRPLTVKIIEQGGRAAQQSDASANDLNDYAWLLLTCEPVDLRDPDAALPVAKRAVEMSGEKNAGILDTLALAYFMTGDTAKAVETQEKAVAQLPQDAPDRADYDGNLAKYRAALAEQDSVEPVGSETKDQP